jgi:hypothetical protein
MRGEGYLLHEIEVQNSLEPQMFVTETLISTASKSEGQSIKPL